MSRRLPVLGGARTPSGGGARREVLVREERVPVPVPTVCVFAASEQVGGAEALARALVTAFVESGSRVGALVSVSPGEEPQARAAASALEAAGAERAVVFGEGEVDGPLDAFHALPAVDVVVAPGGALPRTAEPTLLVMVTGGLLPPAYGPLGRALGRHADVSLGDPREGFARALAACWRRPGSRESGPPSEGTCP